MYAAFSSIVDSCHVRAVEDIRWMDVTANKKLVFALSMDAKELSIGSCISCPLRCRSCSNLLKFRRVKCNMVSKLVKLDFRT